MKKVNVQKTASFDTAVENTAFNLWLMSHQTEARKFKIISGLAMFFVGAIIIAISSKVNSLELQIVLIIAATLAVFFGPISTVEARGRNIKENDFLIRLLKRRRKVFTMMAQANLKKKYDELTMRWSMAGDKGLWVGILIEDFKNFIKNYEVINQNFLDLKKQNLAGSDLKKWIQESEEIWKETAQARLNEITNLLKIGDEYFLTPLEITDSIKGISGIIEMSQIKLLEICYMSRASILEEKLRELQKVANKIPEYIQSRELN